jgi:hypothetical protein
MIVSPKIDITFSIVKSKIYLRSYNKRWTTKNHIHFYVGKDNKKLVMISTIYKQKYLVFLYMML